MPIVLVSVEPKVRGHCKAYVLQWPRLITCFKNIYTSSLLRSNGVGIDLINNLLNVESRCETCEHFYDAAVIRKRCALQHIQILYNAIVDNILHDLVDEVDLIKYLIFR